MRRGSGLAALGVIALLSLSAAALAATGDEGGSRGGDEGEGLDGGEVFAHGPLSIIDPWCKSAIGAHEARLFFQFRNAGEADALVGARSPVASGPTLLRLVRAGPEGRRLENLEQIPIPARDGPFELSEVGYFVELTELEVPLVMGSQLTVTLEFARAGSIAIPFANRFHAPSLARRIRAAIERGDLEALRSLRGPAESQPE